MNWENRNTVGLAFMQDRAFDNYMRGRDLADPPGVDAHLL